MTARRRASTSSPIRRLMAHTQEELDKFKLWGWTFKELCNY